MELIHGVVVGCNPAQLRTSPPLPIVSLSLSLSCFTDTLFSRSAPRVGTLVAVAQQNTPDPVIKSCVIAKRERYTVERWPSAQQARTCRKQKARQLDRVILLGFLFAFVKVTRLMNSSTWLTRRPSLIRCRLNNQDVFTAPRVVLNK